MKFNQIVVLNSLPESNPKPEVENPKPEMMGYEKPDPIPECLNPTRPETREKSTRLCPTECEFERSGMNFLTWLIQFIDTN